MNSNLTKFTFTLLAVFVLISIVYVTQSPAPPPEPDPPASIGGSLLIRGLAIAAIAASGYFISKKK